MQPGHLPGTERDYGGPKFQMPLRGKHTLLYAMRNSKDGIDVGRQELVAVERLARWYGLPIETKSLGGGGYRVRGAGGREGS